MSTCGQNLLLAFFALTAVCVAPARAQDPFEIEVYPYETAARGEWEMEAHFNYTGVGTRGFDGLVAPTQDQARLTLELTRGITSHWEVAGYVLTAHRPGAGLEYAGWRVRTTVRAPETWRLPVRLGLVAEYEATQVVFGDSPRTFELTTVLERGVGAFRFNFDPTVERDVAGAAMASWEVEPKARAAATLSRVVTVGIEYFGKLGEPDEGRAAVHQVFPGVDLHFGRDFTLNLGLGFGTASAADRLVFKSRVEFPLGGEPE